MGQRFYIDPDKVTPARKASLFSLYLYYSSDQDKPDVKHSNQNEIAVSINGLEKGYIYRVNHKKAFTMLQLLIEKSDVARAGSKPLKFGWWTRAVLYENMYFREVFHATPGNILWTMEPEFYKDEKGNTLLQSYVYKSDGNRVREDINGAELRVKMQDNWDYWCRFCKANVLQKMTITPEALEEKKNREPDISRLADGISSLNVVSDLASKFVSK